MRTSERRCRPSRSKQRLFRSRTRLRTRLRTRHHRQDLLPRASRLRRHARPGRDIRCLNKDGLQHHDSSSVPRFPFIKREDGRRAGAKVVLLLLTLHPAKILWNFTALHDPIPRQYSPRALLPTDESHVQWLVSPGHHIASSYRTDGIAGPCNYSSRVLCSARTTDIVRSGASHRSCPHHVG